MYLDALCCCSDSVFPLAPAARLSSKRGHRVKWDWWAVVVCSNDRQCKMEGDGKYYLWDFSLSSPPSSLTPFTLFSPPFLQSFQEDFLFLILYYKGSSGVSATCHMRKKSSHFSIATSLTFGYRWFKVRGDAFNSVEVNLVVLHFRGVA